jgi:hypothetical protein
MEEGRIRCACCRAWRTTEHYPLKRDGTRHVRCAKCVEDHKAYRERSKPAPGSKVDRRHFAHVTRIPPIARLTIDDVRTIRALHPFQGRGRRDNLMTIEQLAEKFGVHRCTIEAVLSGRTWSAHW